MEKNDAGGERNWMAMVVAIIRTKTMICALRFCHDEIYESVLEENDFVSRSAWPVAYVALY